MAEFDRIRKRGERLRKMMEDTLSPERAWDTVHQPNSPPKRYPNPNFLTNPDINDQRNFDKNGGNSDEDDDFYDYLSEEEEYDKNNKRQDEEEKKAPSKQHAIDDDYHKRIEELEKQKKLDELRNRINQEAHHNLAIHQINQTRTVDPFARQPDPPLVLQLYLRVYGAMYIDPRDISLIDNSDQKLSDLNVFRNTFVQYKDFPKGNKQKTPIMWNSNSPIFNYKAYFPFIVREDMMALLSKFFFLFEVWDQISPDKHNCVGFTKLSLSCFFKSLVFQENGMLNTAYFEDDSNAYPMVGYDDNAEIVNFEGKCVGWLKLTVALGNPDQVNRFDSIQAERDRARQEEQEEKKRQEKSKNKRKKEAQTEAGKDKEVEKLLRELIDTVKDKTNSGGKREKGRWSDNQLESLKKFFEEMRLDNTRDIQLKVFKESTANCKNLKKVPKSHFENDLLDNTSLNRKAVSNICAIWDYDSKQTYDLEELQKSYLTYCKYCNYAEGKIKSIFEKLQAFFKLTDEEEEEKKEGESDEEDDQVLKNKNIATLWCKDDEMKEGFNLIIDLFRGGETTEQNINMEEFLAFIKSPPWVNRDHISLVGMKHEILTKKVLTNLTKDFEPEIAKNLLTAGERDDPLIDPIKLRTFVEECRSGDLNLSIWEGIAVFESVNKLSRNEPERYLICGVKQLLEALEYQEIWDEFENTELEKRRILEAKRKKKANANVRKSLEDHKDIFEEEEAKQPSPTKKPQVDVDGSGIFDREDELIEDENQDDDEIFDILNADRSKPAQPVSPSRQNSPQKFKFEEEKDSAEFIVGKKNTYNHIDEVRHTEETKTTKVKHVFEINVKEIRNSPILKKILKDLNRGDKYSQGKAENRYIQDIYLKYIFPLDDEQVVSDYIEFNPRHEDSYDFNVSLHSFHSYLLEPNKPVTQSLAKCGESFTISLSCLKDDQDMNLGNIQMPIDDLVELAEEYDKTEAIDMQHKQTTSSRILFLYGTKFSQREDILIGKVAIDFIYKRELVETSSNRVSGVSVSNDLYLQKEVYISRKIPLNGYLNINIGALSDLKGSLENVQYLMSLYNDPDTRENMANRTLLSAKHEDTNHRTENIDRKRALLKIYQEGLNLGVVTSIFEETKELKSSFGDHHSKVVFQTLQPDFNDDHEYRIKMDNSIFEHLKYRSAVFEIRHYFVDDDSDLLDLGKKKSALDASDVNSEFQTDNRDYITLGYAKVPLVNLITKTNGINQDVAVLDNFSQKLGYLKIQMSLNYQSRKKLKIYKEPVEKPLEGKYFLGLSFVELISQKNKYLQTSSDDELKHLLFKFKWDGKVHQVRYVPDDNFSELPLDINVYNINKLALIEYEINEETLEKAATPLEIQMWTKVENKTRCMKDKEELIGCYFVDIHSLIGQRLNNRLRTEALPIFNTHDGYYTLYNVQSDGICSDRLGLSTMLIKQEYSSQKEELEKMFYTLHNHTQKTILEDYDLNLKGAIEISDMKKAIDRHFRDKEDLDLVYRYLDLCELKDPDTIYYAPLMNVPPPFFKYARRIDREQIIEFMHKRLSSVDNYGNGFVENNMFKSILECEVNLKEKIVDDFSANLKPNPLDYNLITHTMKLKTDYLLLIRKLYGYLVHWDILKIGSEEAKVKPERENGEKLPIQRAPDVRMCNVKVSITCANNIKNPSSENNPPNTYVCFKPPFECQEKELRTPVIYRTTFPQWSYEHTIENVPVGDFCTNILQQDLEFEVFHKRMPNESCSQQESILIGKAYVNSTSLLRNPAHHVQSGYYHIYKNAEEKNLDEYDTIREVTQGQIEIKLSVDKSLQTEFDNQVTERQKHQEVLKQLHKDAKPEPKPHREENKEESTEPENALQRAIRRAQELRAKRKAEKEDETITRLRKTSRSPERNERKSLVTDENQDHNVLSSSIEELRVRKELRFKELNDLTNKLRGTLGPYREDVEEETKGGDEDDLARATNQDITVDLDKVD